MAIIKVTREAGKRVATANVDGKRTYTDVYLVVTDSGLDGPATVAGAVDPETGLAVPELRAPYFHGAEFDLQARVKTKQLTIAGNGAKTWYVTVQYDTDVDDEDNPLDRPAKWSMSFAAYTRVADQDIEGAVVQNSAGMQYNPPVEIDDSRPVIRIVRNEPRFNMAMARFFKDKINQTGWKTLPPRTAKIKNIQSGELQEENGVEFFEVTYEIELSDEGQEWTRSILDAGFYERDANGELLVLVDANGEPYQEPIPLDGAGRRLKPGQDPIFIDWRLLHEADFNMLGL